MVVCEPSCTGLGDWIFGTKMGKSVWEGYGTFMRSRFAGGNESLRVDLRLPVLFLLPEYGYNMISQPLDPAPCLLLHISLLDRMYPSGIARQNKAMRNWQGQPYPIIQWLPTFLFFILLLFALGMSVCYGNTHTHTWNYSRQEVEAGKFRVPGWMAEL